jgi:hypothetical protein
MAQNSEQQQVLLTALTKVAQSERMFVATSIWVNVIISRSRLPHAVSCLYIIIDYFLFLSLS